jgi:hypothetical protein
MNIQIPTNDEIFRLKRKVKTYHREAKLTIAQMSNRMAFSISAGEMMNLVSGDKLMIGLNTDDNHYYIFKYKDGIPCYKHDKGKPKQATPFAMTSVGIADLLRNHYKKEIKNSISFKVHHGVWDKVAWYHKLELIEKKNG